MIYIKDLIRKKKYSKELTQEEIEFFISSYNRNEILMEQVSSMLTLIDINGLSEKEMSYLATAIAETGELLKLYEFTNGAVDIHPIGGMDDKIVIMLLAIINALEMPSIKTIGREIGIKDKLCNKIVYKWNKESENVIEEDIENNKIILLEEPEDLAPVENKLYELRNNIACNDNISIMAVSLMSQKIALGFKNIIFDISYGENYVKDFSDAEKLAKCLIKIGNNLNINVKCIITNLQEPVGRFFGNSLELQEALNALNGNMDLDVKELILELGSSILQFKSGFNNRKNNKQEILNVINNKKAYYKLLELIDGTNLDLINKKQAIPVIATESGYIDFIDMTLVKTTAKYINAIRYTQSSKIELGAGIEFCKKVGDEVKTGELLGYIYTSDNTKVQKAVNDLKSAFYITNQKVKRRSRVIEIL